MWGSLNLYQSPQELSFRQIYIHIFKLCLPRIVLQTSPQWPWPLGSSSDREARGRRNLPLACLMVLHSAHTSSSSIISPARMQSQTGLPVIDARQRTTVTNQDDIHEEIKGRLKSGNACYHWVQDLGNWFRGFSCQPWLITQQILGDCTYASVEDLGFF
jgi:hypothetical protein